MAYYNHRRSGIDETNILEVIAVEGETIIKLGSTCQNHVLSVLQLSDDSNLMPVFLNIRPVGCTRIPIHGGVERYYQIKADWE